MTNKEAIEKLKDMDLYINDDLCHEAIDKAIEALKETDSFNPCENCQEFDCSDCLVRRKR